MDFTVYTDAKGLIVQFNGDGGDCLQREGFWYEGKFFNPTYPTPSAMMSYTGALVILHVLTQPERYWQAPYNNPSDTSRDQLISNIRACGYFNHKNELKALFWGVVKNFSRFPNGDIAFVNDYARFIRAFGAWYLYPILFLFDVPLIVNSIIRCIAGRDPNNVGDDVNHIGDLAQTQNVYATPTSWIARTIYKRFRPFGPQYALDWYFRAAAGGNPEFAVLWASTVANF